VGLIALHFTGFSRYALYLYPNLVNNVGVLFPEPNTYYRTSKLQD
jgi:hypothetical protein